MSLHETEHINLVIYDIDRLQNAVEADPTVPFVGHQWEDKKAGALVTDRKLVETGTIYDLKLLRRLKAKGQFALRGELDMLGELQVADSLIFGNTTNGSATDAENCEGK
jgi:hypothetical protein